MIGTLASRAHSVCLLDDDGSVLKAMSRLLSSEGWQVESFSNPIHFLHYAQAHHPPLVVLDILMPELSGLEVQTQLRTFSPSTHVVILTSNDDPAVRSKAMDGGASAFFVKPVNDSEFLASLQSVAEEQVGPGLVG